MREQSYIELSKIKDLKQAIYILSIIIALIFFQGCSTSGNQNSFLYKSYHDLTAHYNRYFNSKLILTETYDYFKDNHKDNYDEILPLYIYGDEEASSSKSPDLDEVVKKSSVNIKKHQNSKWIDDAYYHIGQAYYLKRDYEEALAAFTYITSEFKFGIREKDKKKRPKTKGKSRSQKEKAANTNPYYDKGLSIGKHKPARWNAIIWIIKSYTELGKFSEAQSIVSFAKGDKQFPEPLMEELYVAVTHLYIKQENYNYAADAMKRAIELANRKKDKKRYVFILGQIYQKQNLNNLAIESYKQVLELKPDFEMEFHSKINIAKISKEENLATNEEILALLNSMIKSEKYKHFLGEVYFTMGELYKKENELDQSLSYFNKSVQSSSSDNNQKALAYLEIGDIYFSQENYEMSKVYHDSTLAILSEDHDQYEDINERKNVLSELVKNINVINDQDSLQYLGSLSEEELKDFIEEKKKVEEEKEKDEDEEEEGFEEYQPFDQNSVSSNWPFDDVGQKSTGYNDFLRIWGDRPRVDNWRRIAVINQEVVDNNPDENPDESNNFTEEFDYNNFGHLPRSEGAISASNSLIAEAYYRLGYIYKDKLLNSSKSIESFETLMERFPDNEFRLETAYNLYLLYQENGNTGLANKYKNIVLNEFPESILAKVINDPNYMEASKKMEKEVTNYYASTYQFFVADDFQRTLSRKYQADSLFPGNFMQPKFDMLEALSIGKMGNMDSFRVLLQKVVNKYPFDEVKPKALAMLNALEGIDYGKNDGNVEADKYKFEPDKKHFLAILFFKVGEEVQEFRNGLANFNAEFHSLETYQINSVLLNNDAELVLVKKFKNASKAKAYYNSMRYNEDVFKDIDKEEYEVFYISEHNYGVFFREKDINAYMSFFTQKYLQQD